MVNKVLGVLLLCVPVVLMLLVLGGPRGIAIITVVLMTVIIVLLGIFSLFCVVKGISLLSSEVDDED
jgi:hypothetical protein